jgi:hypothetical protein
MAKLKKVESVELVLTEEEAEQLRGLLGHTEVDCPLGGVYEALDAHFDHNDDDKEYINWHFDGSMIRYVGVKRG